MAGARRSRRAPRSRRTPLSRIFSEGEKKGLLVGHVFVGAQLDHVDFACADLRAARFADSCLCGSDFSETGLRGAHFVRCDLGGARFKRTKFVDNYFVESSFVGAVGLSKEQREYIEERGGSFLRVIDEATPHRKGVDDPSPSSATKDGAGD